MRRLLISDFRRCLKSRLFQASVIGICVFDLMECGVYVFVDGFDISAAVWMRNFGFSSVNFLLLTFYALLAGFQYYEDRNSGYEVSLKSRCGWKSYAAAKPICCAVMTYIGAFVGHLLSVLVLLACGVGFYEEKSVMHVELFGMTGHIPIKLEAVLYVLYMNHVRALLGVVMGMLVLALSAWMKNGYVLLTMPTLVYMCLNSFPISMGKLSFRGIYSGSGLTDDALKSILVCLLYTLVLATVLGIIFYMKQRNDRKKRE